MAADPRIDSIVTDVRSIRDKVDSIHAHVIKNTADLEHHIERTDKLEGLVLEHATLITSIRFLIKVVLWVVGATGVAHVGATLWK
jgi:hypothetical protein